MVVTWLCAADQWTGPDVHGAGEGPVGGVDRDALMGGLLTPGHRDVRPLHDPAELALLVKATAAAGDLVVCLGAGTITNWANALPGELAALAGGRAEAGGWSWPPREFPRP